MRLIEPMVKGGYYHAGQVCVSTQRIYVHSTLMAEFVERFVARVRALRVGDPLLPETEVGPLITPREVDRVESWVEEAVTAGAKLVVGGKRISATTHGADGPARACRRTPASRARKYSAP